MDRFVRSLPEGYDTVLEDEDEGFNVSAGESLRRKTGMPVRRRSHILTTGQVC